MNAQWQANDLLNLNMQSISNELSSMLEGELQSGAAVANVGSKLRSPFYQNYYQQQRKAYGSSTTGTLSAAGQYASGTPQNFQLSYGYECNQGAHGSMASSPVLLNPKFEYYYLRSQSFNSKNPGAEAVPLISNFGLGSGPEHKYRLGERSHGGFRKLPKLPQKPEEIDYDKVNVDLSVLGLSSDGKERNPVLRLFGLFREMHYYLNDIIPSPYSSDNTEDFSQMPLVKASMPCTMNVQYQVKQASRKCTIFLCDLQRILNANKLYDRDLYAECEHSLNALRKLIGQFDMFKRVELEHKRGRFVTDEGRAQAEHLELLVQRMNDQIRESHIYVHLFNWAMEKKNKPMLSFYEQQQLASSKTDVGDSVHLDSTSICDGGCDSAAGDGGGGGGGPIEEFTLSAHPVPVRYIG